MTENSIQNLNDEISSLNHQTLTHEEFLNEIRLKMKKVVEEEPLLNTVESDSSLSRLKTILSLEHGESMNVFIRRGDDKLISEF